MYQPLVLIISLIMVINCLVPVLAVFCDIRRQFINGCEISQERHAEAKGRRNLEENIGEKQQQVQGQWHLWKVKGLIYFRKNFFLETDTVPRTMYV